jgi:hypothetical protein
MSRLARRQVDTTPIVRNHIIDDVTALREIGSISKKTDEIAVYVKSVREVVSTPRASIERWRARSDRW